MSLTTFLVREAIVPNLTFTSREGVVREMVASIQKSSFFREKEIDEIVEAVIRREQIGSTGIGRNIAIPHTRYSGIEKLVGTVGISREGVSFGSIDGEVVHIFFLLISPQERPTEHLRALEAVVRVMRDDRLVHDLKQATDRDAIWNLLEGSTPVQ